MRLGAVTLVHGEPVARVALFHAQQKIVPKRLGQDGCGGNAGVKGVPAEDVFRVTTENARRVYGL